MLLLMLACAKDAPRVYDASLFEIGAGYSAKMMCSCLFVMERDEPFCAEWTQASPDIARFTVDLEQRTVTSRALGMGRRTARFVGVPWGCVLE